MSNSRERDSRVVQFLALPRTEKVYHQYPNRVEHHAQVIKRIGELVALDGTIFYAESGGQVADRGTINGIPVRHVAKVGGKPFSLPNGQGINIDTVFIHKLDDGYDETAMPNEGDEVLCQLDWDWRFKNMQMHTLAHLLFIATGEVLEADGQERQTLGCHIEDSTARFDFYNNLPLDVVDEIQSRVQTRLDEGGVATVTPIDGSDDAFMWRLNDIEIPCGGTHVNDLSLIKGGINVSRRNKGSGKVRMSIALDRDVEEKHDSRNV